MTRVLSILVFLIILISCDNTDEIKDTIPESKNIFKLETKAELRDLIDGGVNSTISTKSASLPLAIDTLVPNPSFAKLLNTKGEIQVNDTIYRITPNGTYYCHFDDYNMMNLLLDDSYLTQPNEIVSLPDGEKIGTDLYLIKNSILRFDTFKSRVKKTKSAVIPPVYFDRFKTIDADAKTVVGGWLQGLIGRNKGESSYFGKKRRVKVNFYFYDYVVYDEVGVTTTMQKKNWIGWSGTRAPQLQVAWSDIRIDMKLPATSTPMPSKRPGKIYLQKNPMSKNLKLTWDFWGDYTDEFSAIFTDGIKEGSKELMKYLKNKYGSPSNNYADVECVRVLKSGRVTYFFFGDKKIENNCEKLNKTFATAVGTFKVNINTGNVPSGLGGWIGAFSNTLNDELKLDLKCGSVYGCAYFDDVWKGVRVVKK